MLEILAEYSFYCFLHEYFSDTRISTAHEDPEKTIFTCPLGTYAFKRLPFELYNAPSTFQSA